jgi:hypothetical protein
MKDTIGSYQLQIGGGLTQAPTSLILVITHATFGTLHG